MEQGIISLALNTILHISEETKKLISFLTINVSMVKNVIILETTYKNSYLGEKKEVCPAKTKLETKVKGMFTNSKAKFTENSDFKAFSPEFHAISTSKHSYV